MTDAVVARGRIPKIGRTELYRHFAANGELLYVGISLCAVGRLRQHRATAEWFDQIARIDVEVFPSREEALSAEYHAVTTEGPKYNTKFAIIRPPISFENVSDCPEEMEAASASKIK